MTKHLAVVRVGLLNDLGLDHYEMLFPTAVLNHSCSLRFTRAVGACAPLVGEREKRLWLVYEPSLFEGGGGEGGKKKRENVKDSHVHVRE